MASNWKKKSEQLFCEKAEKAYGHLISSFSNWLKPITADIVGDTSPQKVMKLAINKLVCFKHMSMSQQTVNNCQSGLVFPPLLLFKAATEHYFDHRFIGSITSRLTILTLQPVVLGSWPQVGKHWINQLIVLSESSEKCQSVSTIVHDKCFVKLPQVLYYISVIFDLQQ